MEPYIQNLLEAAAIALIGIIAYGARALITVGVEYLKTRLSASQYQLLQAFAATTVRTFQQSPAFENLDSEKKKELAIIAVTQYAEGHHLPISRELCDKVIEEAVQVMKTELAIPLGQLLTSPVGQ